MPQICAVPKQTSMRSMVRKPYQSGLRTSMHSTYNAKMASLTRLCGDGGNCSPYLRPDMDKLVGRSQPWIKERFYGYDDANVEDDNNSCTCAIKVSAATTVMVLAAISIAGLVWFSAKRPGLKTILSLV